MTVMRLPKEKLAFIVDIVTPGRVAFRGMPDFDPLGWVRTLRAVEKLDFAKVVPGHGPPSVGKIAVTKQREYLEDLMDAVQAVRKTERNPDKVRKLVAADPDRRHGGASGHLTRRTMDCLPLRRVGTDGDLRTEFPHAGES